MISLATIGMADVDWKWDTSAHPVVTPAVAAATLTVADAEEVSCVDAVLSGYADSRYSSYPFVWLDTQPFCLNTGRLHTIVMIR